MIDTKELRQLAQAVQTSPRNIHERVNAIHNLHDALPSGVVLEILDRLEAAESDAIEQARLNGIGAEKELALMAKLEAAEKERDWHAERCEDAMNECDALRAKIAKMEQQELVRLVTPTAYRWRYRGAIKWQYGELTEEAARLAKEHNHEVQPLYALPGAQPAPSFADAYQGAMEDVAIWKKRALEAEDLNRKFVAEINGPAYMGEPAPSVAVGSISNYFVSISDHVARQEEPQAQAGIEDLLRMLVATPGAQPTPSVPEDFSREELEAVAAGLDTYEKTVNVGNVTGEGDDHLESTTAYAARFIRAMIAIAPEAKS